MVEITLRMDQVAPSLLFKLYEWIIDINLFDVPFKAGLILLPINIILILQNGLDLSVS
jgi:hypothetical protein